MNVSLIRIAQRMALGLAVLLACSTATLAQDRAADNPYTLGPSDEISLRVVAWDSATFEFTDLAAISGAYSIASDGTVMLPIIGVVKAAETTTAQLAARVADELEARTGLSEKPSVAIEIVRYRPVFVLGDVAKPGEYPYRPGMNVMQLLALAGGYNRLTDDRGVGLLRDGLRTAGSLRETRIDAVSARMREARLLAEASGKETFDIPTGLSHPAGAGAIEEIYARERDLLTTRRAALDRRVASLESSRALLQTEVEILQQKRGGIAEQVRLMSTEVGNLETLLARGLVRSPSLVSAQRILLELQARELDAESQIFRARQSIGEIERDLDTVVERRETEVLSELQTVQAQVEKLKVRGNTQANVLVETRAETALLARDEAAELVTVFRVLRSAGDESASIEVAAQTVLHPLDVLEVIVTDGSGDPSD